MRDERGRKSQKVDVICGRPIRGKGEIACMHNEGEREREPFFFSGLGFNNAQMRFTRVNSARLS